MSRPPRRRPPNGPDLRLLVPSLTAWAACASVLGVRPVPLLLGAALAGALALALTVARRSAGRSADPTAGTRSETPGLVQLVALTLACLSLVGLSAAAHAAVRDAGPVAELAADHAVVEVVGTVTSDPAVVTGARLDRPTVRLSPLAKNEP